MSTALLWMALLCSLALNGFLAWKLLRERLKNAAAALKAE